MNIKLLLLFIIISIFKLINSSQVLFNDQIDCITTPCQWSKATNWIGGALPQSGDNVVINIGSRSVVEVDLVVIKDSTFGSVVLGSTLKVLNSNLLNGTISNVIVNGNLNINSQNVGLSNVSGNGVVSFLYQSYPNPSSGTISSSTFKTLNIIGGLINVEVSNSKITQIIQSNIIGTGQFADQPTVTFSGDNTIGSIRLVESGINFKSGSKLTLNGLDVSNFGKKPSNSSSSSSSSSSSTSPIDQNINLNYQISILKTKLNSVNSLSIGSTSQLSITSSTINSNLNGNGGSLTISGLNTINGDLNITGTSLLVQSDHVQTNIEGSLLLGPQTTMKTVGVGSPLVIVSHNTVLKGSLSVSLDYQPKNNKKYTLIKSIGSLTGNFSSFSFQIKNEQVDSSLFSISTENSAYSLTYGAPDESSNSTVIILNYLLLLSLLLISIF
ncbi:hypothetical protein DDB_G0282167 [Dictyostelium discoideum AX4]|uniref:Uncharacterized protein n=1 Tax=Dictyostelium discoideum TaxID=44689 RepID=Q54SW9_DICDI|nr:hypothetical protein DDB_G0282167 [Dictyostelium discoideum AX4]EAL66363.1 hypothetical protein DDB_G0282167 [Dictyostelium discoideum AX4]|eukprot:XP_640340.1 hypothetical protein DDB_G0282167 [Dictyostelium discoideum AX4]